MDRAATNELKAAIADVWKVQCRLKIAMPHQSVMPLVLKQIKQAATLRKPKKKR